MLIMDARYALVYKPIRFVQHTSVTDRHRQNLRSLQLAVCRAVISDATCKADMSVSYCRTGRMM